CLIGLALTFWPMFRSGFALVPGDLGDARFINYVLEHDYRWAIRDPNHPDLWSTPALFPLPNTLAFSDNLLGVAPLYGLWRVLGAGPQTALQLWALTCAILDFGAFWLYARRCWSLGAFASGLAAFVFAFGNVRIAQINHLQLLPQFYSVVAL